MEKTHALLLSLSEEAPYKHACPLVHFCNSIELGWATGLSVYGLNTLMSKIPFYGSRSLFSATMLQRAPSSLLAALYLSCSSPV